MNTIIDRLKEPSTQRGISVLLGLVGFHVSPEQSNAILSAVLGLLALIEVFRKETPPAA